MSERIRAIRSRGQSIWIDFISRDMLASGALRGLIDAGVTGMTSNPTIFQKSIAAGSAYDADIRRLARAGLGDLDVYEALVIDDIRAAADALRGVYDATAAADGYVSLEVNPKLAADADATIAEGRRLFAAVGRPNVMIKVPGTPQGLPAITTLLGEGVNVNVTLIFSIETYGRVIEAFLRGIERLDAAGGDVARVASVASFFVSRVDTLVDERLRRSGERGSALAGRAAIANARLAYARFREAFGSGRFDRWKARGARVQRPLWASTSTKNPAYPPTMYVDALVGPDTVNTLPLPTLELLLDGRDARGVASQASSPPPGAGDGHPITRGLDDAQRLLRDLAALGIDMRDVTDALLADGVRQFADSFDRLLEDLRAKRAGLQRGAASA